MSRNIHQFHRLPQVDPPEAGANDTFIAPVRSQPLVGVIRNGRSHRNGKSEQAFATVSDVIVHAPQRRSELPQILADFARRRVDMIAIDGGDGTVRDVITCGAGVFGDHWPALAVLPSGKTNALGQDLGLPKGWSLADAVAAYEDGRTVERHPIVIAQENNPRAQVRGFVMGAGAFTRAVALGQRSHKMGAFNSAVVAVTAAWSVAQALVGRKSNSWRRGTTMHIRTAEGNSLPHFGGLPDDRRFLLLASTLRTFPAGLNPFKGLRGPLRVAVLDSARRGLLLRIGSLLRGAASDATKQRGAHLLDVSSLKVEIGGQFILDGEAFPAGSYRLSCGDPLQFIAP